MPSSQRRIRSNSPCRSNTAGAYTSPNIVLGIYTVRVEKTGFKTFVRSGIILIGGQIYRQDAVLQIGDVTETVEVVIGMTALPEARLAREAEIAYALIALPTDYDCWRQRKESVDHESLLKEIIANLNRATKASIELIKHALGDISLLRDQQSPAHNALELGIWSDKSKIDPAEIRKLEVLWGRYF